MIIEGNKLIAGEGKLLQRVSDGYVAGKIVYLGKTWYMYGQKLETPFEELPEHFTEIDELIIE